MANEVSPWILGFSATQLLELIRDDCKRIPLAHIREALQSELKILIRESKKPTTLQDRKQILSIRRKIHPDLRHYGLLNAFTAEPMRTRILNFLKGQPIEVIAIGDPVTAQGKQPERLERSADDRET